MTVKSLHALLSTMIKNGHARKPVCISKDTFKHPLESDGCTILPVESASIQTTEMLDGDGATEYRKDGQAKSRTQLVLDGGYGEDKSWPGISGEDLEGDTRTKLGALEEGQALGG